MSETPRKYNWPFGALIGLAIGVAMVSSKAVEKMLGPEIGEWGAFGVSLIAAAFVAACVGVLFQSNYRQ
jgi:hypothetical protein